MKFKMLIVRNFLSIGKMTLDFNDYNGITLIEGVNKDSKTSFSNGAGKSSIFEAIFWCLYGKTKRGLTGDNVINNRINKDCYVEVIIDDLQVIRTRKHSKLGSNLYLYKDGKDLTRGAIKETQAELERLLGMSELTFLKTVSFGQGDIKPFTSLSDKELKEVFEQALKLTELTEFAEKVKRYKRNLEGEKMDIELKIGHLEKEKERVEGLIAQLEKDSSEFKEVNQVKINELNKELERITEEAMELKNKLEGGDDIVQKVKELNDKLAKYDDVKKQINELNNFEKERLQEYSQQSYKLKSYKVELEKMLAELKNAENKIGSKCKACNRVFNKEDVDDFIIATKNNMKEIAKEFELTKQEAQKKKEKLEEIKQLTEQLGEELEKYNVIKEQLNELNIKLSSFDLFKKQLESSKKQILQIKSNIKFLKEQSNPYVEQLNKLKGDLDNTVKNLADLDKSLKEIIDELEITDALANIFGTTGLKGYIFENITPELNRIANEYVNMLDDISIEISTVKKLSSGEIRDKFSINVDNTYGAKVFAGNSGGEQQKINLAISLAFNTLLRAMSSNAPDIIFLDEPFESLDAGSSERVVELCEKFGENLGKVFIITHNQSLKDIIPTVLKVVKENGYSKIM